MALKKSKEVMPVANFTVFARLLEFVLIAEAVLIIFTFFQTYGHLPSLIPAHFGINGLPDAYWPKDFLVVLPFVLSFVLVITVAIAELRHKLMKKYPWVLSLPSFYLTMSRLPKKEQALWVSKYFEALLIMGAVVGLALEMIQLIILDFASGLNATVLLAYPLVLIAFAVVEFFIVLWFFSKKLLAKAKRS